MNRQRLLSLCPSELDQARILAASAPHSGDWIHAIPSDNCGLLLDDETLRIAVGVRLGSALCLPYTCICGASIDEKGLHSFACKKNSGRYIRHSILNDVIWRSLSRAKIHALKEPAGLSVQCGRRDGAGFSLKRPDGASITPWRRGKSVSWDVTVANTFANSYIASTSVEAGTAAEIAAVRKKTKYLELAQKYLFVPLVCEVTGVWCSEACDFLNELGSRICEVTGDKRETSYLFQRLSIGLQKGNAACVNNFPPTPSQCDCRDH